MNPKKKKLKDLTDQECRDMGIFRPEDFPFSKKPPDFPSELESLINRYSQENASNTPDFILAQYMLGCLEAFNAAVKRREEWYGRWKGEGSLGLESEASGDQVAEPRQCPP
jgi:hypothetical protein